MNVEIYTQFIWNLIYLQIMIQEKVHSFTVSIIFFIYVKKKADLKNDMIVVLQIFDYHPVSLTLPMNWMNAFLTDSMFFLMNSFDQRSGTFREKYSIISLCLCTPSISFWTTFSTLFWSCSFILINPFVFAILFSVSSYA